MSVLLKKPTAACTPIVTVQRESYAARLAAAPEPTRRWLQANGFNGAPDTHLLVPAADGGIAEVWAGVRDAAHPYVLAALPRSLPAGRYRLDDGAASVSAEAAAHSWTLGGYQFDLYKPATRELPTLLLPPGPAPERGLLEAHVSAATRDLVNTPAEQMGPA